MKKRVLSYIFVLIMLIGIFNALYVNVSAANKPISVYIDGEKIAFDVEPEIINGRTMVPMRKIFEYLGADVEWFGYDQTIIATCGYLNIEMQIGTDEMRINDEYIKLDSPPVIKKERTLVPLRAVAEAFSSEVEWVAGESTVIIETPYPKNEYCYDEEFDKYHIRTSYGDHEYFDFDIDDDILTITGCIKDEEVEQVAVMFDDGELKNITSIKTNKIFRLTVDLSREISDSESKINVYTKKEGDRLFWSYVYESVFIEKNRDKFFFKKPLVWENNKDYMAEWKNPIGYINPHIDGELIALSNEICKNADNDYDKVLLIHDWVADNIYYNYDYYYNRSFADIEYEALGVYKSRRSVCEGYANLTQALINAQGIPCKKVHGYSLGLGAGLRYWDEESASTNNSNHAWNQAYVDNRWINMDTTWDSGNKYENGEFLYKGIENHLYFDISDVFFSYNHKYIE